MAKSTIEKFIQTYLKGIKTVKKKDGYEAWLRKNGIDPTAELSDSIGKIYAANEKINSESSARAESLANTGLKNSGYAEFLKDTARLSTEGKIASAIDSYLGADSKHKKAYDNELERLEAERIAEEKKAAELLAKEEAKKEAERIKAEEKAEAERIKKENEARKEAEKLAAQAEKEKEENRKAYEKAMTEVYKRVEAEFKSSGITDYEKAYKYAINMGLNEADAQHLARTATDTARNSKISKVTSAILSKRLTMNQAKEYALTLGLSEEDATLLGEFAFKTNESVKDIVSQQDYLDYLREQANKNK